MIKYNSDNVVLAKNLRKNATPWENKLWFRFLKYYEIRFKRQKPIGNYIADFYCHKARLIVELDGSGHYEDKQTLYDMDRTAYFNSIGLKVIRIVNTDVDKRFFEVCSYIDSEVKKRLDVE
jgi:very-short-patch-repair endonuclease